MNQNATDRFLGTPDFPFFLVRTSFHGGGVASRHITRATAERKADKLTRGTDCTCGCYVVVPAAEYAALPMAGADVSAYAAVRK